jgi:hypothetical protein
MRRHIKRLLLIACALAGVIVLLLGIFVAALLLPVRSDPSSGFRERKGKLTDVAVTLTEPLGDTVLRELRLRSTSGLEVELSVRIPTGHTPPHPAVLLLGGQRTGRDAVKLIPDTLGTIVAAVSYPYRGNRDAQGPALFLQLPKMQQGILDTPPAVMLALDYLFELPEVDHDRVEIAGVSLGAFLISVPGAMDTRVRRVWVIHGAGQPKAVLEHGLQAHVGSAAIRKSLASFLSRVVCGSHLAPERWVGKISPREVIVVNALDDEALPRDSIEILHRSLGQPSEVIWRPGQHVKPRNEEVVADLARLIFERIVEED